MQMDPTAADPREVAHIFVERFYIRYIADEKDPSKTHPVEMVLFGKKGQHIMTGQKTPMRITQAKKDRMIWATLEPYYNAWKNGQEAPTDGTPLAAWPGLTPEAAERLRVLRVRTVEDVAALSDNDVDNFGMGGLSLRQQARAFIDAKKDKTQVAAEVATQLAARDETMAAMQRTIETLTAQLAEKPEKRKPGRPAKAAEAA
jgi:hypothetical protein